MCLVYVIFNRHGSCSGDCFEQLTFVMSLEETRLICKSCKIVSTSTQLVAIFVPIFLSAFFHAWAQGDGQPHSCEWITRFSNRGNIRQWASVWISWEKCAMWFRGQATVHGESLHSEEPASHVHMVGVTVWEQVVESTWFSCFQMWIIYPYNFKDLNSLFTGTDKKLCVCYIL